MMYMVRTQIYLPKELHQKAKQVAKQQEISLAELSRIALEEKIEELENKVQHSSTLAFLASYPESKKITLESSAVELVRAERDS